jgi:NADH dehydrogenase
VVDVFGVKGAAEHAFPLYALTDAIRLKAPMLKRFEAADKSPALADDGALTVRAVGGGATGVEVAGALAELINCELKDDYPGLPTEKALVLLYEMGPGLLSTFKPNRRVYAKQALAPAPLMRP